MGSLLQRSGWYFASSVSGACMAVFVLPLATRVIGAAEYGEFAIALAVAGLVTSVATAAIGYLLSEQLLKVDADTRRDLLSSALIGSIGAALAAGAVLVLLSVTILPRLIEITTSLRWGILLCLLGAIIGSPWLVGGEVLMLEGRAKAYAVGAIGQGVVNAMTVLTLLYLYPVRDMALFLGNVAGQFLLLMLCVVLFRRTVRWPRGVGWFREMRKTAIAVGGASLAENGRTLFERAYLGAWTTVADVGLFVHAQLYRNWAMIGLNSVSRAVWPINLQEAREKAPTFVTTIASWSLVQAAIAGGCVVFALFGAEVIHLLTSGKFAGANGYALILLCSLLIQTAGKPHMALLIANGHGARYANAITTATIVGVALTAVLVPFLGAAGAAWAALGQFALMRGLTIWASRKVAVLQFREDWVVAGLIGAAVAHFWVAFTTPGLLPRAAVAGAVAAGIGWLTRGWFALYRRHGHGGAVVG